MGRFQPGQEKPIGSGRKRGSPNKRHEHIVDALSAVGLNVPERLFQLLPELSIEKQADVLLSLMVYLYPKRKAVEMTTPISERDNCIEVVIVDTDGTRTKLDPNR